MTSVQLNFYEKVAGQIDPQLSKDDGSFQKSWVIVSLTPAYFHRCSQTIVGPLMTFQALATRR